MTLPRLSPEIPASLAVTGAGGVIAELADALRAEGILRPSDWSGGLAETVHTGLSRWHYQYLGGNRLLRMDLAYGDDVTGMHDPHTDAGFSFSPHYWCGQWGSEEAKQGQAQVGVFVLACGLGDMWEESDWGHHALIGAAVTELNALCPGAGYSLFGLIQTALELTVGGITPACAVRFLEYNGGFRGSDEGWEDEEITTRQLEAAGSPADQDRYCRWSLRRFRRDFPRGVWTAKWRPASVRRALRGLGARTGPSGWEEEALEAALALAPLVLEADAATERNEYLNEFEALNSSRETPVPAVLLRWGRDDLVYRVWDEIAEDVHECGGFTTAVLALGWETGRPVSIRRAVRRLRQAVEIVAGVDRLLALLHREPKREEERIRCAA